MNWIKRVVFLTCGCVFLMHGVHGQQYSEVGLPISKVFGLQEHNGSDQNWWLSQSENGFIYVGSGTGITQFDGERWRKYVTPNSTRVRALAHWKNNHIYAGTIDDLGVYQPDDSGQLIFRSLIADWPTETRQFGEIWSVAASEEGVAYVSNKQVYFWDGTQIHTVPGAIGGKHRIFSVGKGFVYKTKDSSTIHKLSITSTDSTTTFLVTSTPLALPKDAYVRKIFTNRQNEMTIITAQHGIFVERNNALQRVLAPHALPPKTHLYNAIQASDGLYYLVSLYNGLLIMNESFELVRRYQSEHHIHMSTLYSALEDHQGNIWLSGIPGLVKMLPPQRVSEFPIGDNSTIIDKLSHINGHVVAAGDGLFQLNASQSVTSPPAFWPIIASKNINFDAIEYHDFLLFAGEGGVYARALGDPQGELTNILRSSWARSIKVDPVTQTLFVSTYDGLFHIEHAQGNWNSTFIEGTADELEFVAIEDEGVVWAGTASQELYRIENAQFSPHSLNPQHTLSVQKFTAADGLGPGNVMPFTLSSGVVMGTSNGMMDYQANRTPALQYVKDYPAIFTTEQQDIFRLYEDANDRIWFRIGQHTGYIKKDQSGQWQVFDAMFKPFSSVGFNDFLTTDQNTLWFAQKSGQLYKANIKHFETVPQRANLHVHQVSNVDNNAVIYGNIASENDMPELDQTNNSVRMHFALSDSHILRPTRYRHRLLGSSHDAWSDWSHEHQKDFTLLPGGDFIFQLEAQDAWAREYKTELPFAVKPVWYLSTLAWFAYLLILLTLLALSGWLTQRWRTGKLREHNALLEKTVADRTLEISHKVQELEQQQVLKERFFNNVSHEFRTPLTLTIAPLQDVLNDHPALDSSLALPVKTALRNAKNMLQLVGNILDINRLNIGQFPLRVAQYNVVDLVHRVTTRFEGLAKQQQQTISLHNIADPISLYFDLDQLDKCMTNLLSNALKYSGRDSEIDITLINTETHVGIEVRDNGPGIEPAQQNNVFERYFQGESSEHITQPGTGIGLALIKELIELHHGTVELQSEKGQGCRFTLWLQRGQQHFSSAQLAESISYPSEPCPPQANVTHVLPDKLIKDETWSDTEQHDITTVLVIDDNAELRQFIALRLSGYYRITQAENGEEGLAKAISVLPDVIICDVMMPKMDGLTLMHHLRGNQHTRSIPIILLSAKSAKRDTVEGLQRGADDYLTKPFDTSELVARVDAQLRGRKLIREKLEAEFASADLPVNDSPNFTDKLRSNIIQHLTDPEFTVDQLAESLAMSRRSLSRKCQSECQQTIVQFMTEVRMQSALKLLNESKLSVSEIAYGTGYESLSYFSRTFKKFYGKAPSTISQS
ncbi:two component transcriptional regulator, AraC family [Paraglaciecola sp. T6c]|uniref:hybrid sensor histidine kinase/response regulator transcription factor n=1 Tax=Pseudoalteromonas atlantica (strain T6c / ATCC BAA-1087) TaxID=3042615 RepID=UPI00005C73CF|nr:ATP-binding protein [Paraglaciecola sp. T6c]ABG40356.1 two component transcriptional regulator, AraC family [Paraglaciecola sp. T6c]